MAFKKDKKNEDAVNRVLARLEKMERGDTLSHDEAAGLLRVDYPSPKYYALMRKVKLQSIAARGRRLYPTDGIGYKISEPTEQLNTLYRQDARRIKGIAKSASSSLQSLVDHSAVRDMSADEQDLLARRIRFARQAESEASQEARLAASFARPRGGIG